jgi:hypothetical protein
LARHLLKAFQFLDIFADNRDTGVFVISIQWYKLAAFALASGRVLLEVIGYGEEVVYIRQPGKI